jgi:hypothetical protein
MPLHVPRYKTKNVPGPAAPVLTKYVPRYTKKMYSSLQYQQKYIFYMFFFCSWVQTTARAQRPQAAQKHTCCIKTWLYKLAAGKICPIFPI